MQIDDPEGHEKNKRKKKRKRKTKTKTKTKTNASHKKYSLENLVSAGLRSAPVLQCRRKSLDDVPQS